VTVYWGQGGGIPVGSIAELDHLLDRIERDAPPERPILAQVGHATGGYLTIGLGGTLSVLTHVPANGYPPYFTSLGDIAPGDADGDESIVFFYCDHWSEFSRYQCLAPDIARRAMRDFFSTGQLPQWLGWEEV